MRIYVAGPYSSAIRANRVFNTETAIHVGYELMKLGHNPFIPHLTHYIDEWLKVQKPGVHFGYDFWMNQDLAWLAVCDALYFIGSSPGSEIERSFAQDHGIPVLYSLSDVSRLELEQEEREKAESDVTFNG